MTSPPFFILKKFLKDYFRFAEKTVFQFALKGKKTFKKQLKIYQNMVDCFLNVKIKESEKSIFWLTWLRAFLAFFRRKNR